MNTLTTNKYINGVSKLVKSFVFKSHTIAVHMNMILDKYGVVYDKDDKYTWPYYLNVCGMPHSANTDVGVVSLDTGDTIVLSRDVLSTHPRTKAKLLEFGSEYDDLVNSYPGQEVYIRGLLTDVTVDDLDTYDGKILYYNSSLVESNEINLINELSVHCGRFIERWSTPRYIVTDNLYATDIYAQLISYAFKQILYMRLNNVTTKEIHTYYQDLTLASNFNITEHKTILSKASTIWLTKNIKHIGQNIGKDETLNTLVSRVLSPSGFDVEEVFLSNTYDKTDTLTTKDKITGDVEDIELASILPSLIYEDNLLVQYHPGSERYGSIIDKLSKVRGIGERTKVIILRLKSFISDIELTNQELIQKAILNTLYKEETTYSLDTTYGRIILTNRELFKSTLIAFFKLYNIVDYTNVSKIELDNLFYKVDVDTSEITTSDERKETLDSIHDAIDTILDSDENYVDKQVLCRTLIEYEMTNANNEILAMEIEVLRKRIVEEVTLDIDETLGEYSIADRLFDNDISNTLSQVYAIFGKEFDIIHKIVERLTACSSLISKLTSYTLTPIIDPNVVDGALEIEPNMILEGETILDVTKTTMDCQGAVAITEAFGSEMVDELYVVGTNILKEVEGRVLTPDLGVHQESEDDYVKVVRPTLT